MSTTSWSGDRRSFPTKMRKRILRKHPLCVACGLRPSEIADHITPVAEGGTDSIDNGQGMCRPCHDEKSEAERLRGIRRKSRKRPSEEHPGLI